MIIQIQSQNPETTGRMDPVRADRKELLKNPRSSFDTGAEYCKESRFTGNMVLKEKEKGKSLDRIREGAGNVDVAALRDYMTVMSNTMSKEDYAELEREGFHFQSMEPGEAVTIVDKIKAEMARSGNVVAGYNDDLDVQTLTEAVGSETLARAVAENFRQADLPLTEENIRDVSYAWELAGRLEEPTDGSLSYMIDQGLKPTVEDFYLAQNSGMNGDVRKGQAFFRQELGGYLAEESVGGTAEMQDQIDKVIEKAGLEVSGENREKADWLLNRGLDLTPDNLLKIKQFESCAFPVREEVFAKAVSIAVSDRKKPVQADLTAEESVYEMANRILNDFNDDGNFEEWKDQLTARRHLEEIRFRMTAEVNVKLLKSNFAIDTAPMEALVSALRKAEAEVAETYFPKDADAVSKYHLLNETNKAVSELPGLPADILCANRMESMELSLNEFHREGLAVRDTYVRAKESYEALMTAPRQDLGDSIRKAFANVDDIVRDLGLDINDTNRRAVRILGYNRMEINPENVEKVRAADEEVQTLIGRLKPAATLKMIRDGINPLEKTMDELNAYLDSAEESFEEQSESYSRFLYRLEKNKAVTERERESYIGIYRLVRQIEKTDGAAVGALINEQAQVHFSNLLSAVRSRKFKGLDVKIEDAFGAVAERVQGGKSISDQILSAFVGNLDEALEAVSYDEEAQKSWYEEEMAQNKEASNANADVLALLERGELAANADHILTANALLHGEEKLLADFFRRTQRSPRALIEKLDDQEAFAVEYGQMLDAVEEETKDRVWTSESDARTSLDVRRLSLLHKQISVARQLGQREEYFIPMYVGEKLAQVHLSVEHTDEAKGRVEISLAYAEEKGGMHAQFTVTDGRLDGFFWGNGAAEVTELRKVADIVSNRITEGEAGLERIRMGQIHITENAGSIPEPVARMSTAGIKAKAERQGTDARQNRTDGADHTELYRIAKLFLKTVGAGEEIL